MLPLRRFGTRARYLHAWSRLSASAIARVCVTVCMVVTVFSGIAQSGPGDDLIVKELDMKRVVNGLVLDKDGFLWIATHEGLYRFDGYDFDLVGGETLPHLNVPETHISAVLEDDAGNIWIGGRALYVITADRSRVLSTEAYRSATNEHIITTMLMVNDELWITDYSSQITCFESVTDTSSGLTISRQIPFHGKSMRTLNPLGTGEVLVTTGGTTYYLLSPEGEIRSQFNNSIPIPAYYTDTITWSTYGIFETEMYVFDPWRNENIPETSLSQIVGTRSPSWFVSASYEESKGLWIGNKKGNLIWYSPEHKTYIDYTSVLSNRIYAERFFSTNAGIPDGAGGLWIGTNQGLIHVLIPAQQHFTILPLPGPDVKQFSTRGMLRAPDSSVFVGSYRGLFRYFRGGRIKEYPVWKQEEQRYVNALAYDFLLDGDDIWIASEGNGLLRLDLRKDSLFETAFSVVPANTHEEHKSFLWQFRIFQDKTGTQWIGTSDGLYARKQEGGLVQFEMQFPSVIQSKVYDIREDANGVLWVGSAGGIASISPDRTSVQQHPLPAGVVSCVFPMPDGRLMIGMKNQGVRIYDPVLRTIESYTTDHGLANNTVSAIQSAEPWVYWISTNRGLSRFDLTNRQFRSFYLEDGLPDNEFNHGSWLTDSDGTMFFGGVGGVVQINLHRDMLEKRSPVIRVSKIAFHDGKAGKTKYQSLHAHVPPAIRLSSRDKYFTVYYSTDERPFNSRQTYAYKLEGLHSDWQVNGTRNFIQFTGLQPGHYTLLIRLLEESLNREEHLLRIPVSVGRPVYKQWWAYIVYLGAIAGVSFLMLRGYFRRQHIQRRFQLESEHRQKLEEINKSKSTFFTNITHEFKTPLTLIQGPAEEINRLSEDPQVTRHANLIARNAQSMLALVNQLLELGKLEADLEQSHFHRLDLVRHVYAWTGNFDSMAKQKQVRLAVHTEQPAIYMDFDPVKMETIVNNLLSNAIKFAPENGTVDCTLGVVTGAGKIEQVSITVRDNGPGIDPAEQNYIFERFFQGNNSKLGGTGIGLAFVREMVRAHKGSIQLESSPGEGARFTILLPLFQDVADTPQYVESADVHTATPGMQQNAFIPPPTDETPVLLIAEDNIDVAQWISDAFGKDYKILLAHNGRDAHKRALEVVPDLVITDVMMPVMDGLTLTHLLKTDTHTSHIPVIMLTARDGLPSRIEGLSHGADVYLNKPFSVNELKLTVRNLLYLRARVLQNVSKQMAEDIGGVRFSNEHDSTFYQSFLTILEKNIAEPALSVQDFVGELGVSRTQLHRKLKAITGHSVNQIVRGMRLQKGLALLKRSGKTIAEVAYEVGFSSPSYFTERFREYYGYPPSEVMNQSRSASSPK